MIGYLATALISAGLAIVADRIVLSREQQRSASRSPLGPPRAQARRTGVFGRSRVTKADYRDRRGVQDKL